MKKTLIGLFSALALLGAQVSQAASFSGETRVELTSAPTLVGTLGLAVQPYGIGSLEATGPTAVFPITGGTATLIEHDGSGLSFAAGRDSVVLQNFLIDTTQSTIFGDVVIIDDDNGTISATAVNDAPLFTFDSALTLGLSSAAADVLNGLFGTTLAAGTPIGNAAVELAPVPLPAAVWLMGSAMGLLFLRRRHG